MLLWRKDVFRSAAFVCVLLMSGCFLPTELEVQVIHYPGFEKPFRNEPCQDTRALSKIQVLEVDAPLPEGCQQSGDVFIGDSSTSFPCEPRDLIDQLRRTACAEGTAITQIIHITSPRGGAGCHQLRAALLRCE